MSFAGIHEESIGTWDLAEEFGDLLDAELTAVLALGSIQGDPSFLEGIESLWRNLAVAEVTGFLAAELADHHFDETWANVAEPALARAVMQMSISEGFYFCSLAVRDLASAYLRYPHGRGRLADTLRWSIDTKTAKAQTERWTTRPFVRHARSPQSAMAAAFAGIVTRLDESYLSLPPDRDNIRI